MVTTGLKLKALLRTHIARAACPRQLQRLPLPSQPPLRGRLGGAPFGRLSASERPTGRAYRPQIHARGLLASRPTRAEPQAGAASLGNTLPSRRSRHPLGRRHCLSRLCAPTGPGLAQPPTWCRALLQLGLGPPSSGGGSSETSEKSHTVSQGTTTVPRGLT